METEEVLRAVSFPVELRDVYFAGAGSLSSVVTKIEGRKAVVRTDSMEALSVVSDQYKLLPYREATEPLLERIHKQGGSLVNRTHGRRATAVRLEGLGKRVWIEAQFNQDVTIGKDIIRPRVVYGNSYDGSTAMKAIVGFYQVVCTNAGALMKAGKVHGLGGGSFSRRHSGGEDLPHDHVETHLREFLDGFGAQAASLRSLANSSVQPEDARRIFTQYCGERAMHKILGPSERCESAWAFYSRVTNYLTMDFRGGQQPSERKAQDVLREIQQVMR